MSAPSGGDNWGSLPSMLFGGPRRTWRTIKWVTIITVVVLVIIWVKDLFTYTDPRTVGIRTVEGVGQHMANLSDDAIQGLVLLAVIIGGLIWANNRSKTGRSAVTMARKPEKKKEATPH